MDKYLNVNLQEEVPAHILRTGEDDDFSSESDKDGEEESHVSDEEGDMLLDHGEEFETEGNSGWADAMAKVLKTNAPKGKKTIVLAKAKKLTDISKTPKAPDLGFEIDGEVKEEKPDPDLIQEELQKKKKKLARTISKREWNLVGRVKPSILDKNREKTIAKIATKGVVQLFNSVRQHQKNLKQKLNEAGTVRQKEKILKTVDKRAFLDMLMGPKGQEIRETAKPEMKEEEKAPWKALRDDFMMGGSLKDWDKTLEESNPSTDVKDEKENISDSDGDESSDDG